MSSVVEYQTFLLERLTETVWVEGVVMLLAHGLVLFVPVPWGSLLQASAWVFTGLCLSTGSYTLIVWWHRRLLLAERPETWR